MSETVKCDMIGSAHCGREIQGHEIGNQCNAHFNMGNKPHQWRTLYQCVDCKKKEDDIRAGCGPQSGWIERRTEAGLSMGQMARLMNLGTAVYSRLEHCKEIAPRSIHDDFERVLSSPPRGPVT